MQLEAADLFLALEEGEQYLGVGQQVGAVLARLAEEQVVNKLAVDDDAVGLLLVDVDDGRIEADGIWDAEAAYLRYGITPRERDVVRLICAGYSNKKIADELRFSTSTVKDHVHNILSKTKLDGRSAIIAAWYGRLYAPFAHIGVPIITSGSPANIGATAPM